MGVSIVSAKYRGYAGPNISVNYTDCLKKLYPKVKEGNSVENPLIVPFVLTCAAALEAKLNDTIVSWAWDTLGKKEYKTVSEALLTMSLKSKIDTVVVLLSRNRFTFRRDAKCYQTLLKLISIRNKLIHNKGFYDYVEVEYDKESDRIVNLDDDFTQRLMKAPFLSIGASECEEFYRAIELLDDKIFYPAERNALSENDVVRPIEHQ